MVASGNRKCIQSPGLRNSQQEADSAELTRSSSSCAVSQDLRVTAATTPAGRGVPLPSSLLELQTQNSFHMGKH